MEDKIAAERVDLCMTLQISVQRSAISLDFQHLTLLLQLDTLDVFHRLGRTELKLKSSQGIQDKLDVSTGGSTGPHCSARIRTSCPRTVRRPCSVTPKFQCSAYK